MKRENGLRAECWDCGLVFTKKEICDKCGFFRCPHCGSCGCRLTVRERNIARVCVEACLGLNYWRFSDAQSP